MLELYQWTVRRGDAEVVRGLDLTVRAGEVLGLAGPSGSGKSSLVASLVGRADGVGQLRWQDEETTPAGLVERVGCGVLLDGPVGAENLSVAEWLEYHALARGVAADRAQAASKALGLRAHSDVPVGHLSGGLQERLVLARTTLHQPPLVLVDHPLAKLDAAGEYALGAWIAELRDRRAVVVWASADRGRLEAHCDRIALLSAGKLDRVLGRAETQKLAGVVALR